MRLIYQNLLTILFFVFVLALLVFTSQFYSGSLDEGMLWSSAMKVAEGQMMYRDFFEFWTPGSVYLLGGLFALFGLKVWVSQMLYVLIGLACYILLYLVLKRTGFGWLTCLVSIGLFVAISATHLALNHHWFGIAGLLATIYFLLISFTGGGKARLTLVLSGLMAAITALFMQYEGVIAISGGLVAIALFQPPSSRISSLVSFMAPSVILGSLVVVYFGLHGAVGELLYSTVFFPIFQYRESNVGFASALWIYQTSLLALFVWLLHKRGLLHLPLKILIVFSAFIQLVGLSTNGFMHAFLLAFLINSLYVYVLTTFLTDVSLNFFSFKKVKSGVHRLAQVVGEVDVRRFGASVLLALFLLIYSARIIEGIGVLWADRLVLMRQSEIMQFPAGELRVSSKIASKMSTVATFVQQNTSEEEPVYFGPYSSYYNLLLQRPNPLPYSQLTPAYNPDWMLEDAVEILDRDKPEYIVLLPRESTFPFGMDNKLYAYVDAHYRQEILLPDVANARYRPVDGESHDAIWVRKSE